MNKTISIPTRSTRSTLSKLSLAGLLACSVAAPSAYAQSTPQPAAQPGMSATPDTSNKAMKPPTDAAASQAGVATRKPSKPGAQSGAQPGGQAGAQPGGQPASAGAASPGPDSAMGNKAAKPPTDASASDAGVATKRPAKPGAQSGPTPASAPK